MSIQVRCLVCSEILNCDSNDTACLVEHVRNRHPEIQIQPSSTELIKPDNNNKDERGPLKLSFKDESHIFATSSQVLSGRKHLSDSDLNDTEPTKNNNNPIASKKKSTELSDDLPKTDSEPNIISDENKTELESERTSTNKNNNKYEETIKKDNIRYCVPHCSENIFAVENKTESKSDKTSMNQNRKERKKGKKHEETIKKDDHNNKRYCVPLCFGNIISDEDKTESKSERTSTNKKNSKHEETIKKDDYNNKRYREPFTYENIISDDTKYEESIKKDDHNNIRYRRKYIVKNAFPFSRQGKEKLYKTSIEKWRPGRGRICCPSCGAIRRPLIKSQIERSSTTTAGAACIVTCWPFCFLPCLFPPAAKEYLHCSNCNHFLGAYNRQNEIIEPADIRCDK